METLKNEVREVIAEILETEAEEIHDDTHFINDLGADSLMALEILVAFEKKYKIKIPEEKLSGLTTLQKTVELLSQYDIQT